MYQLEKNYAILSFCSKSMVDFKILQSDWPKLFQSVYNFFPIWDLCRDIDNNINFHYRTNLEKNNIKTYLQIQINLFLPLPGTTSYGFLTKCQNLGKINDPVSRK